MAKSKSPVKKATRIPAVIDMDSYQRELAALHAKYLKDVDEKQKGKALDDLKKGNTGTLRTTKSSLVNMKYQVNIDDFLETKDALNKVLKDAEPVLFLKGQSRELSSGKLVGYNSSNGDIFVEYVNDDKEIEIKQIKGRNAIINIGKIPVPRGKAT